jgi:hypothetical protein
MKMYFVLFSLLILLISEGCKEATKIEDNMNVITDPVIIYTDLSNTKPDIRIVKIDGTEDKILIENGWLFSSPANGKIAYLESDTLGGVNNVVFSNLDGSNRKVVASGSGIYNCFLSPDASKVMYSDDKGLLDTANLIELHVVNADASNDKFIESFYIKSYEKPKILAKISPDSKRILLLKRYEGNKFLSVNIDGSGKQEIVKNSDSVLVFDYLEWFDNNNIITTSYNITSANQLVAFSYDGKTRKVMFTDNMIYWPVVSHGNNKISYFKVDWDSAINKTEICVVNNNGGNKTNNYIFSRFYFSSFFPTFSSDGRFVVVPYNSIMQNMEYANGLYLYDVQSNTASFVVGKSSIYNGYLIGKEDF